MPRPAVVLLALTLAAVTGCDRPPPDDPGTLRIVGRLLLDNDSPAADLAVSLHNSTQLLMEGRSDADGRYSFVIDVSQVRGAELTVQAALGSAGESPEVGARFSVVGVDVTLPTLRFLEAPLAHTADASQLTVSVPNYADGDGRRPDAFQLQVRTSAGVELSTVEVSGSSSVARVDRLLLEDFAVALRLQAQFSGSSVQAWAAGTPLALPAQNAAPLSRGAACTHSSTDQQSGDVLTPCPLTDGDLGTTPPVGAAICTDPDPTDAFAECSSTWEQIEIDLGSARGVSAVVFHSVGSGGTLVLERSIDGTNFQGVTGISGPNTLFTSPFDAQYLRLRYTGNATESVLAGFNEIAVY